MWKIHKVRRRLGRSLAVELSCMLYFLLGVMAATYPAAQAQPVAAPVSEKGPSGLPLPRFVSLKSDRVNLRAGPGTEYPASWVFRRAGLPLEVTKEFETWRQVRDAEGTTGWVLQSFLSGRRTALVLPWDVKEGSDPPQVSIMSSDSSSSRAVAIVEAGVIANVQTCDSVWCNVTVETYRGYIEQKKLWGVYAGEVLK
jgi:SH3-like domain-containing protein